MRKKVFEISYGRDRSITGHGWIGVIGGICPILDKLGVGIYSDRSASARRRETNLV